LLLVCDADKKLPITFGGGTTTAGNGVSQTSRKTRIKRRVFYEQSSSVFVFVRNTFPPFNRARRKGIEMFGVA